MENKEYDLSKILKSNEINDDTSDPIFSSMAIYEIIKEFIKHCLADGWDEQFVNPNEDFNNGIQFMKERIHKLAGKKLSHNHTKTKEVTK